MESLRQLPDFAEVYGLYEGRRVEAEDSKIEPEKLNVTDRPALDKKISDFAAKSFSLYKKVQLGGDNKFVVKKRHGYRECIPLMSELVEDSIPLMMVAMKVFDVDSRDGEKTESIQIVLLKGNFPGDSSEDFYRALQSGSAEFIGDMRLIEANGRFQLAHREVNPKFRKQRFGDTMLKATEVFVAEGAKDSQKEKELFLDCSQLDVIYWLWKNDYRPKTKEDWDKLENVINGGSNERENLLMLENYFLFDERVPEDERYYEDPSGEKTPAYHNAYRIRFEKKIKPSMGDDVRDLRQRVVEKVRTHLE